MEQRARFGRAPRGLIALATAAIALLGVSFARAGDASGTGTPPPDWVVVDVGEAFRMALPPGMERQPARAQDSLAGEYRSEALRVRYDYGYYVGPIGGEGAADRSLERASIYGRAATLASWREPSQQRPFVLVAHFERVLAAGAAEEGPSPVKLAVIVHAESRDAREHARLVVRSIRFR